MPRASVPSTATLLLAALAVALPVPAPAQTDPAALQLIEQLRPRTRGIRLPAPAPAESGGVAATDAAAVPVAPGGVPGSPSAVPATPGAVPATPGAVPGMPDAGAQPPAASPYAVPATPSYAGPTAPSYAAPATPSYVPPATPSYVTPGAPSYVPPATAMVPARPVPSPAISAVTTAPDGVAAVSLTVNFATGSASLTPQAEALLASLGRALASPDLAPYRFRIEGHTDTVGDTWTNQHLSERRAAAVMNYLINKHGVAPSRLEAVGLGETSLLVPTYDGVNEPRNRRVQVVNLDG